MSESTLDTAACHDVAWYRVLSPLASAELEKAAGADATVASVASEIVEQWADRCSGQTVASPAQPLEAGAASWLSLSPRAVAGLAQATAPGYPLASLIAEIVEEWAGRSASTGRAA